MNLNKKFKVGVHYNSRLLCMFKDGLYPAVFSRARYAFFIFSLTRHLISLFISFNPVGSFFQNQCVTKFHALSYEYLFWLKGDERLLSRSSRILEMHDPCSMSLATCFCFYITMQADLAEAGIFRFN
jgi:hypothetical protein